MAGPALLAKLNALFAPYGVNRGMYTGDTTIGLKGRIIFEAPGLVSLLAAHRALEEAVLSKEQNRFKPQVARQWVESVYEGFYHDPLKADLEAFLTSSQRCVNGEVTLETSGGNVHAVAIASPHLLHAKGATYAQSADWGVEEAEGFIKLFGMSSTLWAEVNKRRGPGTGDRGPGLEAGSALVCPQRRTRIRKTLHVSAHATPSVPGPRSPVPDGLLDATLHHLRALVAFDTRNPPRAIDSDGIFAYLARELPGFEIDVVDHGAGAVSLYAVRGTPKYLFNVHMDTVPDSPHWSASPFELRVTDDRAIGLGACDIKGAAAALIAAAQCSEGDAAFLFSSDEEANDPRCIAAFLQRGLPYEAILVAEPTRTEAVLAHRGIQFGADAFCWPGRACIRPASRVRQRLAPGDPLGRQGARSCRLAGPCVSAASPACATTSAASKAASRPT